MVDQMWGLFLYSVVSGIGFDVSHSISDLNRSYLTKNACVEAAKSLNKKPNRDKQIGLDNGVSIRYVCLLSLAMILLLRKFTVRKNAIFQIFQ